MGGITEGSGRKVIEKQRAYACTCSDLVVPGFCYPGRRGIVRAVFSEPYGLVKRRADNPTWRRRTSVGVFDYQQAVTASLETFRLNPMIATHLGAIKQFSLAA